MVKDVNGAEIQVGDEIKHVFGPFPHKFMDEYRRDPKNKRWLSDGFAGKRTVLQTDATGVHVNIVDSKIPSYLGCYCEVVS